MRISSNVRPGAVCSCLQLIMLFTNKFISGVHGHYHHNLFGLKKKKMKKLSIIPPYIYDAGTPCPSLYTKYYCTFNFPFFYSCFCMNSQNNFTYIIAYYVPIYARITVPNHLFKPILVQLVLSQNDK